MTATRSPLPGRFEAWATAHADFRIRKGCRFDEACMREFDKCLRELLPRRNALLTDQDLFGQACMVHFDQVFMPQSIDFGDLGLIHDIPPGMRTNESPEQWRRRYLRETAEFLARNCSGPIGWLLLPLFPERVGGRLVQQYKKGIEAACA